MKKLNIISFVFCINIFGLENVKDKLLNSKYIICIDGGGSKTSMKVVNNNGQPVILNKNNIKYETIVSSSSNINTVGAEGFEKVLNDLFDDLYLDATNISFKDLKQYCFILAGFAGGSLTNLKKAQEKFHLKGFDAEQLFLTSDAELNLELIRPTGIVLISGTGSVAFGIENGKKLRTGGFGRLLNDAGNGYSIGISGIRAALEDEYGYGNSTALTHHLKEVFQVIRVNDLVGLIHSGEIKPDKIASLSKFVFENQEADQVCKQIVQDTADNLAVLILDTLKRMKSKTVDIILVGGLFNQGSSFINQITANKTLVNFLNKTDRSIIVHDKSKHHIAFEVAKLVLSNNR